MNVPSVGRIVHYVSRGSADGIFESEHRAAIVARVFDDPADDMPGIVDLCVINPTGIFFDLGVPQDEDEQLGGTWHWPEVVNG